MLVTFAMFASECQPKNIIGRAGYLSRNQRQKLTLFATRVKEGLSFKRFASSSFIPTSLAWESKITNVKDILSSDGNEEPPIKQIVLHFLIIY